MIFLFLGQEIYNRMMEPVTLYLLLFVVVVLVNFIPLFMPATWMVLALFATIYHLPLVPTVLVGVTASTIGRTGLYFLSQRYVARFLSEDQIKNMNELGQILNGHQQVLIPLVLAFSILPIPSNHLYIAAGLASFDLKTLTAAFVIGRSANYLVLVGSSELAARGVETILKSRFVGPAAIAIQILGLAGLYLITKISWKKVYGRFYKKDLFT
jgi:membrane protein YqaA with SNARE-associated domain